MSKFMILVVVAVAVLVGCERLGNVSQAQATDGLTAAQFNWRYLLGYAWPVVLPALRLIPVIGAPLQELLANLSWSALATKKQKAEDAGQS